MLTPMTPEELKRHRAMGLYMTEKDMEALASKLKPAVAFKKGDRNIAFDRAQPAPLVVALPPIEYEIQAHDD